jgi:hypothetical protein
MLAMEQVPSFSKGVAIDGTGSIVDGYSTALGRVAEWRRQQMVVVASMQEV